MGSVMGSGDLAVRCDQVFKRFTSTQSVLALSCLLKSSLDSPHVCLGFAGLIKWQISVLFFYEEIHSWTHLFSVRLQAQAHIFWRRLEGRKKG